MTEETDLSDVLSEFARTLITDFPIEAILDHLVSRIVAVLPVAGAGITLIDDGEAPHLVAASNGHALRFEQVQRDLGEGPCLLAYASGCAVASPDLGNDDRFARFGPQAVAAGLAAVFAFPLRHGHSQLGALDLYREEVGELTPQVMRAAQTLADVAAAYLLNAQSRQAASTAADEVMQRSLHDPLTGLPNRMLFKERLVHAAHRSARSRRSPAVVFIDLDRFKSVNDLHGHSVGDELLVAVAGRLAAQVRSGDTLARFSGDEFVMLCEDVHGVDALEAVAARIDLSFVEPFVLGNVTLPMSASVGIAVGGPGGPFTDELVARADANMYQVKRAGGGGHRISDPHDGIRGGGGNNLESDLRRAFERGGLDIGYQPVVRAADGRVTGVEALLRWTDDRRGEVSARSMVKTAERTGMICEIGAWVLEQACTDHCGWSRSHPEHEARSLAVNVSVRQLVHPDFRAQVERVLARTGIEPAELVLEVTESILVEDGELAQSALHDLRELGVRLAIDDFGVGFSSLGYLRRLPVQVIKIDRTLIEAIDDPAGHSIVAAVVDLAHVLGHTVVAEGVETASQRDAVRAMGCDHAQGFFFAHAMSAAAISSMLDREPAFLPARSGVAGRS